MGLLLICGLLAVSLRSFCLISQFCLEKNEQEQLNKIFELCGSPDEVNWPGVSKIPLYNNFKPSRPLKRRVREAFKHFDPHALELLERMLTLDPSQRISTKDAPDAEYFWTDPLPCDPKSLPKYESSHEFQMRKKQRQQEEIAKRQKLQLPQPHAHLPPIQQPGQVHPQMRPGPNQPPVVAGPSHHYGKPHGTPGGLNRYPQAGNPSGGFNPNHSCPPPGSWVPYPGGGGPRGGAGRGYGVDGGGANYAQGVPDGGGSGVGRGTNVMGSNGDKQYGWL